MISTSSALNKLETLSNLHWARYYVSLRQDLWQVLCAEDISQGRLGKKARRVVRVLHIGNRNGGIAHPVVNDGVHRNSYAVFG